MKSPLVVLTGLVICCISIPILTSVVSYSNIKKETQTKKNTSSQSSKLEKNEIIKKVINYETVNKETPIINVYNHKLGKVQSMNMEKYLYGVLAGEMSAKFDIEALKAQAVAARTYVSYKQGHKNPSQHKNAVVCTDFKHCQEYKSYEELEKVNGSKWIKNSYSKIKQAVDATKGQIITYNNEPILPLYFSTSSGKTENSEEVFSIKYPYLKSVDSPYDKISPKYTSALKISNKQFVEYLNKSYGDIKLTENNLKNQVKITQLSKGGAVETMKVGNKEIKGTDVRRIFNLNSANFEIDFENSEIDFIVKGYGHGVGMSQWGAEGMAQEGYKYYEILSHYYSQTEIKDTY